MPFYSLYLYREFRADTSMMNDLIVHLARMQQLKRFTAVRCKPNELTTSNITRSLLHILSLLLVPWARLSRVFYIPQKVWPEGLIFFPASIYSYIGDKLNNQCEYGADSRVSRESPRCPLAPLWPASNVLKSWFS